MADTIVRTATVDDARAIAIVQVESRCATDAHRMPEALLAPMDVDRDPDRCAERWGAGAEERLRDAGFDRARRYVPDGDDRAAGCSEHRGRRDDGGRCIDERSGSGGVLAPLLERRPIRDPRETP